MDIKHYSKDVLQKQASYYSSKRCTRRIRWCGQDDNPFDWDEVCTNIEKGLSKDGYVRGVEYEIMLVPNIVNITYGRGVGYTFEEETFDESITSISATKIRKELREKGTL